MARPSRKIEIKEKVLQAALELIVEGGFQQSPMSKLAQLADLSVGTIYLYFPSKDALIVALFDDIRLKMQEKVLSDYDANAGVKSRFDNLFLSVFNYYLNNKLHFIFMDQFGTSTYNKSSLDAFSEEMVKAFLKLYDDGIQQKLIKPYNLSVILSLINGPVISFVRKHFAGFSEATPKIVEELRSGVWEAISL